MKIKLTDSQIEVVRKRGITGTLTGQHLEIDDLERLITEVTAAVSDVLTWKYTEQNAREIFATRYLLTKIEKMLGAPAGAPVQDTTPQIDGSLESGTVVYLRGSHDQSFTVVKYNGDGSVQVYGGTISAKMFRDFRQERLTLTRPRNMPKPKDEV